MSVKKTEGSVFAQAHTAAANFAAEKPKKKRKPETLLDYDLQRCEALGYGPHYGHYKADHPNTRAEFEGLPGVQKITKVEPGKKEKVCPHCGKTFITGLYNGHKIYCCDECRREAEYARDMGSRKILNCAWCGGEIPPGTHRPRYCCNDCYWAARHDREEKRKEGKTDANP